MKRRIGPSGLLRRRQEMKERLTRLRDFSSLSSFSTNTVTGLRQEQRVSKGRAGRV